MNMYLLENSDFSDALLPRENSKTISENVVEGCTVCGKNHEREKCPIFRNFQHIQDSKIPPRALLTLPANLKVETLADGSKTVIAVNDFLKGTQFGPYEAKRLYSMNPFDGFPIKVFNNTNTVISECYLDKSDENHCNWMCYVAAAYNVEEQNLICYQLNMDIYFSAIRNIKSGEQLKVWYAPHYATKLDAKLLDKTFSAGACLTDAEQLQKITERLPAKKLGAEARESWTCKMCGHVETTLVVFAKHLEDHYVQIMNNSHQCEICGEGFRCEKNRASHKKYVHIISNTKGKEEKKYEYSLNKGELSKTDIIESCLPLPIDNLMSDTLTDADQLDNSNLLMLEQLNLTNNGLYSDLNDVDTLRAILCDNTKASKAAQENSIADFSLELVENDNMGRAILQPPFICDICNKEFQNIPYLSRHLKKHTGEFTCMQCLIVFARKENYKTHPCVDFNKNSNIFVCSFCPKSFVQKKYLTRHMERHFKKFICKNCGNQYKSLVEKIQHNCSAIPDEQKTVYKCDICSQIFFRELYLKKHMSKIHSANKDVSPSADVEKNIVCEICAEKFKSIAYLKQHMQTHSEPKFECETCGKKFFRMHVYSDHILSHGPAQLDCNICGKKVKTKKNLGVHMLQHTNEKQHRCTECGKRFLQRTNMIKHMRTHAKGERNKCVQCNIAFGNRVDFLKHKKESHPCQGSYICSVCQKSFEKSYQMKIHMLRQHSDKVYLCKYCSHEFKHRNSIKRHLVRTHQDKEAEWSDPSVVTSFLVDKNLLPENSKNSETLANTEVLLSLPETDQQITLGKNAYILEDGTIVQPQDEGNVMYYVLDEQLTNNCL